MCWAFDKLFVCIECWMLNVLSYECIANNVKVWVAITIRKIQGYARVLLSSWPLWEWRLPTAHKPLFRSFSNSSYLFNYLNPTNRRSGDFFLTLEHSLRYPSHEDRSLGLDSWLWEWRLPTAPKPLFRSCSNFSYLFNYLNPTNRQSGDFFLTLEHSLPYPSHEDWLCVF